MHNFASSSSENLNRNDWIRFPSDVSTTRWFVCKSKPSISTGALLGQRIGSCLSIRNVSVFGLYSPPGEILVGGSAELGRTQMLPFSLFDSAGFVSATELLGRDKPPEMNKAVAKILAFLMAVLYSQNLQSCR